MQEKILTTKKNGMPVLILLLVCLAVSIALTILGGVLLDGGSTIGALPFAIGLVYLCGCWILIPGFKILKPQEALVLTLFGKYIGTLKGDGFYFVNPFSVAVNPAAKTQLNQSGDVTTAPTAPEKPATAIAAQKLSLKVMTLSNNRQKINDCLGTPVEIGIAVTWRIVDTAKAVFTVDNYKEFLSLQCDASLRNIVRLYPYDVAPNVDTTGDGMADDGSLRGSSEVVASRIRAEIAAKLPQHTLR